MPFKVQQAYAPRRTRPLGVLAHRDWRLKRYSIAWGEEPVDERPFSAGRELALAALPSPAEAPGRPGAGILIEHRGLGADYVVLAWWDRENELPLRVFVREGEGWRPATGGESVCVWDLEVLAAEREAYVHHVLRQRRGDVEGYLYGRFPSAADA